jgi:RNA polymerase sigma-70 factor (ECF subfamily)
LFRLSEHKEMELVRRALSGEEEAFRQLVEQNEQQVRATVLGMLGQSPQVEDVAQEVFIRFYQSLGSFRGESAVSTYLTRIAINLSLNQLEKNKRRNRRFIDTDSNDTFPDSAAPDDVNQMEMKEMVEKGLGQLEPLFRVVIVLRMLDGYSLKETAQILELPVGTVASRLSRGQEKLKKIIEAWL